MRKTVVLSRSFRFPWGNETPGGGRGVNATYRLSMLSLEL